MNSHPPRLKAMNKKVYVPPAQARHDDNQRWLAGYRQRWQDQQVQPKPGSATAKTKVPAPIAVKPMHEHSTPAKAEL